LFGQSIRGRDFTSDDNRAAAEPVAIISDRLWTRSTVRQHANVATEIEVTRTRGLTTFIASH
jgi:hypothetical protein